MEECVNYLAIRVPVFTKENIVFAIQEAVMEGDAECFCAVTSKLQKDDEIVDFAMLLLNDTWPGYAVLYARHVIRSLQIINIANI